ncbi:MAG: hypothetical protein KF732_11395 [Flavobacteriales bacterium]|jgi:hypothetical protein|nr:hypothetical protein [Flavobacteriales bacterium]MBX2960547.1 hypothetical protein [Flavobacteriales bacterium]
MEKLNLLIIGLVLSLNTIAQSSDWTKSDRNALYEEGMKIISKNKSLTEDQKSTISLCYLNEITKKYTKSELDTKIDIELKRIQESVIITCAKNIGVDLNEIQKTSNSSEIKLSKEAILGQWYSDGYGEITFKDDNTYKRQDGCTSTFVVTEKEITISKETGKGLICPQSIWKVVKLTSNEMVVISGSQSYTFNKIK